VPPAERCPLPAANALTALQRVGAQATAFAITPKERSVGLSGRRSAFSGPHAAVYLRIEVSSEAFCGVKEDLGA